MTYDIELKLVRDPDSTDLLVMAVSGCQGELARYVADDAPRPLSEWCNALGYWGGPVGNGWSLVSPEDIGALTDDPYMVSDAHIWDDHGNVDPELLRAANVYYYPKYQTTDILEEVYREGFAVLKLAPNSTE